MLFKRQHRGIERKILTSIVWVSIVPMCFTLAFGYMTARWGQAQRVAESLAVITRTTAAGLELNIGSLRAAASNLAHQPVLAEALAARQEGLAIDGDAVLAGAARAAMVAERDRVAEARMRADRDTNPDILCEMRLYAKDGRLLVTTAPPVPPDAALPKPPEPPIDFGARANADFAAMFYDELARRLHVFIIAPVQSPARETLGYVVEKRDITPILSYAFGRDPNNPARIPSTSNEYQLVTMSEQGVFAWRMETETPAVRPHVRMASISDEVATLLSDSNARQGTGIVNRFPTGGGETVRAFVGYHQIVDEPRVFMVVFQPASAVYRDINFGAGLALLLCSIFIGIMCLNAYRNVHNNIVRPLSLLNEGAQIIGQGDLELKLKIDTGDEIHELAASFNKMASDLRRNIGQLGESEERYRTLVTSMRDGIFHADHFGRIVFMNGAGMDIFGIAAPIASSQPDIAALFCRTDDLTRVMDELAEKGFVERSRIWMKRHDGREIVVELSLNQVHDDDGGLSGVEGLFRDVTMSVQLEQEARERSERIAAINQIANVINSSLEAGRVFESLVVEVKKLVACDYAALSLLNDRGDAFATMPLWPPDDALDTPSYPVDDPHACAAWVARRREYRLIDDLREADPAVASQFPAGTVSCVSIPLYATGRIIGALILGSEKLRAFSTHDAEVLEQMAPHIAVAIRNAKLLENLQQSLEEVTRAREKLHEANEELKTLDEMKTNLLSNVSHELRTPLVSVMGYTDMILNEKVGPITETQRDYLRISLRNIDKLVTLIENLLDFSRLHRGTETIVFDTFDLVDCARASLQVIKPVAESREIELVLNAPGDPVLVDGDKGKLGQVFNNLLSNAVKFNSQGGRVAIDIEQGNGSIQVTVSDTGIGIPAEALDKVFTRFYQYDSSSTRKYGGTGIGLAIAQDIARLHGANITVTSEPGKGSAFRFNLPDAAARRGRDGESLVPLPTETELLIELVTRDRALLGQVRSLLETEGMEIINATSVDHAALLAERHRPDCIILDVDHDDDPATAVQGILEDSVTGRLPIIVITNDDALVRKFRGAAMARLKRDFRKSTLLSSIRYTVNQRADAIQPAGNKVLCVDDDPEILMFMKRCLDAEGYEVDVAGSGEEALERAASGEYSLILLDIAMPGLDGWATCSQIKANPALSGVRVCMVTAKPVDSARERNRAGGPDGILLKPFRPEDLIDLVRGLENLQSNPSA